MKVFKSVFFTLLLPIFFMSSSCASPTIYLFLDGGPASAYKSQLANPKTKGAQIIYSWKYLEPNKNTYNFKAIKADLKFLKKMHKSLFIQIQDRSFDPKIIPVPRYLLSKQYNGGVAKQTDFSGEGKPLSEGWVAKQWVPGVRQRFQKLLIELSKQFDGKIAGINLPETAIDLNQKKLLPLFTCSKYFATTINNIKILRKAFKKSSVVQYVNFFPCEWNNDHHYMSRLFDFAEKNHIGLGGPDVVPYRRGQMKNSYPYFNHYKRKLPLVAFAVQEPDYTYTNPKTGKHFSVAEIYHFAQNYLGATILFWNVQKPQYTKRLLPFLKLIKKTATHT